jgi:phage-related minor tail protein
VGLVACGSDSPSASEKVCDARSDLRKAVDNVEQDVSDGNFGKARDQLSDVTKSFDDLSQAASQLKAEQAQALKPEIDALTSTVTNLKNAQSLGDIQTGLGSILTKLQTLYTQVADTLKC